MDNLAATPESHQPTPAPLARRLGSFRNPKGPARPWPDVLAARCEQTPSSRFGFGPVTGGEQDRLVSTNGLTAIRRGVPLGAEEAKQWERSPAVGAVADERVN